MRTVFSFHPNLERAAMKHREHKIKVGNCLGHQSYFVVSSQAYEEQSLSEKDAISAKKCVIEISQAYAIATRDNAEKRYSSLPIKRIAKLLAKLIELYPSCASSLIMQSIVDKMPHKNISIEIQYLYNRMIYDFLQHSPISEERILDALVDKLCQLDVDIKSTKSRRKCQQFSSLSKIQPMSQYIKELNLKIPNEKETKMGILLDRLFVYVRGRIDTEKDHESASEDSFIEQLLRIFEVKIFPLHKVNFIQYLPLYVIGLSQDVSLSEYSKEKCRVFTEKLLSFLIFKAFKANPITLKREHLIVRQHAINYLASLLSRENDIIKPQTVLKCIKFTLQFYQSAKNEDEKSTGEISTSAQTEASESDQNILMSQDRVFIHSFIQALAHILVAKHNLLQREDTKSYMQIIKLVFKKHIQSSLPLCSPIILADLLKITQQRAGGSGLYVFHKTLMTVFKRQKDDLQTSKRLIYDRISKFFPFDQPYYILPAQDILYQSLIYEDVIVSLDCTQESPNFDTSCVETDAKIPEEIRGDTTSVDIKMEGIESDSRKQTSPEFQRNSEIDISTSGPEEHHVHNIVIQLAQSEILEDAKKESQESQAVIYEPDINQIVAIIQQQTALQEVEVVQSRSSSSSIASAQPKIDLTPAIALSRQTDQLFNINNTLSADAHKHESQSFMLSRNSSKLSSTVLQELNNKTSMMQPKIYTDIALTEVVQDDEVKEIPHQEEDMPMKQESVNNTHVDFFEIASSSKDTEYSTNPQHKESIIKHKMQMIEAANQELSEKQKMRRNVEKCRRNITQNLKEENDRANHSFQKSAKEAPIRKSPRFNKTSSRL